MKRVYKYPLTAQPGEQLLRLPQDAEVLSFALDPLGQLVLYALVDPTHVDQVQHLAVFLAWTGWDVPMEVTEQAAFVGSLTDADGFVWHAFIELS